MENVKKHKAKGLSLTIFSVPIYGASVCHVKYDNITGYGNAIKYLKKLGAKMEGYYDNELPLSYGFIEKEVTKKCMLHIIFINNCKEYRGEINDTVAHENYHLVQNICLHHGLEVYHDSHNEHIAYLTGYLFNIISKL